MAKTQNDKLDYLISIVDLVEQGVHSVISSLNELLEFVNEPEESDIPANFYNECNFEAVAKVPEPRGVIVGFGSMYSRDYINKANSWYVTSDEGLEILDVDGDLLKRYARRNWSSVEFSRDEQG